MAEVSLATGPKPSLAPPESSKTVGPTPTEVDALGAKATGKSAQQDVLTANAEKGAIAAEVAPETKVLGKRTLEDDVSYETIMLRPAASKRFHLISRPQKSTFYPNMQMLFAVLDEMDQKMANTHRWIQNCQGWNPMISRIYMSVISILQVFRTMRHAGILPTPLTAFLRRIESLVPPTETYVPGPLVPYINALSVVLATSGDTLGAVTPALPQTPGWSHARMYRADDAIAHGIGNVAALISRLNGIYASRGAQPWSGQNPITDSVIPAIFGQNCADIDAFHRVLASPGFQKRVALNSQLWESSFQQREYIGLPQAPDFNAGVAVNDTWADYLMLANEDSQQWFGRLAAIMAAYCKFWQFSATLNDCGPSNSAVPLVKLAHTNRTTAYTHLGPFVAATHSFPTRGTPHILVAEAKHVMVDFNESYVQGALVTQINCFPNIAGHPPTRFGDFWTIGPDVQIVRPLEILASAQTVLVKKFHSSSEVKEDNL